MIETKKLNERVEKSISRLLKDNINGPGPSKIRLLAVDILHKKLSTIKSIEILMEKGPYRDHSKTVWKVECDGYYVYFDINFEDLENTITCIEVLMS